MLEKLKGKKVTVFIVFGDASSWGSMMPAKRKGVLTDITEEAIMLDNSTYIARKFIISVEA